MVDPRWVLTWKMVEGVKTAKAGLVATSFQDPDLKDGVADASECVSLRPSRLQIIPLSAKKWGLRALNIKNACRLAAGFSREIGAIRMPAVFGN